VQAVDSRGGSKNTKGQPRRCRARSRFGCTACLCQERLNRGGGRFTQRERRLFSRIRRRAPPIISRTRTSVVRRRAVSRDRSALAARHFSVDFLRGDLLVRSKLNAKACPPAQTYITLSTAQRRKGTAVRQEDGRDCSSLPTGSIPATP
jgi:hypothetical protein